MKTHICPRCHTPYNNYPAISRRDNKTPICSECGRSESLFDFWVYAMKKQRKSVEQEIINEKLWLNHIQIKGVMKGGNR